MRFAFAVVVLGAAVLAVTTTSALANPAGLGAALLAYYVIFVAAATVALYAWMIFFGGAALGLWVKGVRLSGRRIFAALALAPLVAWATSLGVAAICNQRHEAFRLAAERLPPLSDPPRTLVVHTDGLRFIGTDAATWRNNLVEMGLFDEVYATGPWAANWQAALKGTAYDRRMAQIDRPVRHSYTRSEKCRTEVMRNLDEPWWTVRARVGFLTCATAEPVDEVPQDGLHLFIGNEAPSRLSDDYPSYYLAYGPYELRLRSGATDRLVGYWDIPYSVWPIFPPAISLDRGFQHRLSIGHNPPTSKGATSFIVERLGPAPHAPTTHPTAQEIGAEYKRLLHSSAAEERVLALMMGAALGSSFASRDDIRAILSDKKIVARLVDWSRYGTGFCRKIGLLTAYKDDLISACRRDETDKQREDSMCWRFEQRIQECEKRDETEIDAPF